MTRHQSRPRVFQCRQCGGPRCYGSAMRCRTCYRANAAERRSFHELDELDQLRVLLREMERQGTIHAEPGDIWAIGPHPEQINALQAWALSEAIYD